MDKETFNNTEKLFHYTRFEKALKIIESRKFLLGELSNMNDIHESYRRKFYALGIKEEDIDWELEKHRQLSFVIDRSPRRGYDIPAMWGHYAEEGTGICLVFDKKKFLTKLPPTILRGEVKYANNYDSDIVVGKEYKDDLSLFFEKNASNIFFTKTSDWSCEQEFRLIGKDVREIYFGDSLMAIIMCTAKDVERNGIIFNSVNKQILDKVKTKDVAVLAYGCWDGRPSLVSSEEKSEDWAFSLPINIELDVTPNGRIGDN